MNVGDYVRTKNGIDKVAGYRYEAEYENGHVVWFEKSDSGCRYTDKDLPKSSPNIIDLIEVGDYVNGMLVIEETPKDKRKKQQIIVDSTAFEWGTERLFNEDIKSIVTKEQFESIKYEVN